MYRQKGGRASPYTYFPCFCDVGVPDFSQAFNLGRLQERERERERGGGSHRAPQSLFAMCGLSIHPMNHQAHGLELDHGTMELENRIAGGGVYSHKYLQQI